MRRNAATISGMTTTLGAMGAAVAFLAGNKWFGAGDLAAMAVWSLLLGGVVALVVRALVPHIARVSVAWGFVVLTGVGVVTGVLWTVVASLLLGGWIGAFSFPVLFCWGFGGVLGGTAAAWAIHPRGWGFAVIITVAAAALLLRLNAYAVAPEPQVRVVLRPGASDSEIERAWTEVVGRATGRGNEATLLPGITGVGASGHDGESEVLTVSFEKRLSRERRAQIIAGFLRSPLVSRVDSGPARRRDP